MRLWTFRDPEEWKQAEKLGRLRADGRRVMERAWLPAYRWMKTQMKKRIAGYSGRFPLWAWSERQFADLRKTGHAPKGSKALLVECEIPAERVLLSDFTAWHFALNDWHLGRTEAEHKAWLRRWGRDKDWHRKLPAEGRREIEASWEVMFDPEALDKIKDMDGDRALQAVFEELVIPDEVVSVREFVAR